MIRELNTLEIEQVSAGLSIGNGVGGMIGGIADSLTSLIGLRTNATHAGEILGEGIDNAIGGFAQIGSGVVGVIKFGIDAISQLVFFWR